MPSRSSMWYVLYAMNPIGLGGAVQPLTSRTLLNLSCLPVSLFTTHAMHPEVQQPRVSWHAYRPPLMVARFRILGFDVVGVFLSGVHKLGRYMACIRSICKLPPVGRFPPCVPNGHILPRPPPRSLPDSCMGTRGKRGGWPPAAAAACQWLSKLPR